MSDFLKEIFRMQEELNDQIFLKKMIGGCKGHADGSTQILTVSEIRDETKAGLLGPNDLPNKWFQNYLLALQEEAIELKESLLWKWWSKDKIDLQNARVEIIDMLHFLVSLALVADMTAEDVHRIYVQKYEVNLRRQESGYSKATKTEDDNIGIK